MLRPKPRLKKVTLAPSSAHGWQQKSAFVVVVAAVDLDTMKPVVLCKVSVERSSLNQMKQILIIKTNTNYLKHNL